VGRRLGNERLLIVEHFIERCAWQHDLIAGLHEHVASDGGREAVGDHGGQFN
jgi:hypothetical protein